MGHALKVTAGATALLRTLLRLAALLVVGFLLFEVLPGDPARAVAAGRPVTSAELAGIRHDLGLDRSPPERLAAYAGHVLTGDLGESYVYHRPVTHLLAERIGPTLLLVGVASLLAVALGTATGAWSGWRPRGPVDRAATAAAIGLWATPTAWLGLLLLALAGAGAGPLPAVLPLGGMRSTPAPGGVAGVLDVAAHLVLPCLTLAAVQFAQYHLLTRSATAAERTAGYVTLARAKGLRDADVRRRHVLPNAAAPSVAAALVNLGVVASGAVTVEAVFSWPGLGYLAYESVSAPDLPVLNGTFLLVAAGVVVATGLGELARARLDPRSVA